MTSDPSPNDPTQYRAESMPEWLKTLNESDADADERDKRHFRESHISATQHARARQLALGEEVLKTPRIYLDLKYWIYCRDARAGRPQRPVHAEIWRILSQLAADKRVICPVTQPVFAETFKQQDLIKRKQTAEVIDILSRRVAIQPNDVLEGTELAHLLQSRLKGKEAVYPLSRLVWTFPGWLMGQPILDVPALDKKTLNWMRKCIFDRVAAADFSMIVDALEGAGSSWDEYNELYTNLNAESSQHRDEVTSFEVVFLSEVAGILDAMKPRIAEYLSGVFMAETSQPAPAADSLEAKEATRLTTNIIYHAYRLKKLTTEFPALYIGAGLHAAVRLRGHPYKRGDLWDFRHAHPALAYCNAFFTEKDLGNLLCRPPLNYDKAYGCDVLWNDDDIVAFLRDIARTEVVSAG